MLLALARSTSPTRSMRLTGSPPVIWIGLSSRSLRLSRTMKVGEPWSTAVKRLRQSSWSRPSTMIGGGTAISAVNVLRHTGAPTAGSSVTGPSTTLASTASAVLGLVDSPEIPTTAAPHQLAQELELFRPQVDCENVIPVVSPRPGGLFCKQVASQRTGQEPAKASILPGEPQIRIEGARGTQKFSSKNIGKKCA